MIFKDKIVTGAVKRGSDKKKKKPEAEPEKKPDAEG